jgi:hypothetical protein
MLKDILPDNLKDTKFEKGYSICSYDYQRDFISFRRKEILQEKEFNHIFQMYFHRKLSNKEILITALLHELGHRKFTLENPKYNYNEYPKEVELLQRKYNINCINKWNLAYWQEIKTEREAMNFAKEYFFRYRIRSIIKKVMKG